MSSALGTLRRDFGGGIIEPGGAEYESAGRSLLASGKPAHVLPPQSVEDVQAGARFAARAGLLLSVRGGGHGFPGFGTNDGGVVIDLSKLANVEIIDSERHLGPWRTSTAADVTAEPLWHGPPDHGRPNLAVSVAPSQSGIPSLTWSTGM
jgi:hypothetical protein